VGRDAGADVDDMAAVLLQHLADGALGQPEESGEVDADDQRAPIPCEPPVMIATFCSVSVTAFSVLRCSWSRDRSGAA
jgi:hypothetical protein